MSNNLQSKLGEGLSKFQGGLEQGKQKLQVAQEIGKLNKELNETASRKAKVLVEVGLQTYQKIRTGQIVDPELEELTKKLIGLDQNIYQSGKKIAELNQQNQEDQMIICPSCETQNSEDAKFCGGCGAKVEIAATIEVGETFACIECEEDVPVEANFCPCCGTKTN